jgi:hypothetical protein
MNTVGNVQGPLLEIRPVGLQWTFNYAALIPRRIWQWGSSILAPPPNYANIWVLCRCFENITIYTYGVTSNERTVTVCTQTTLHGTLAFDTKIAIDLKFSPCCEYFIIYFGRFSGILNFLCQSFGTLSPFHFHRTFKLEDLWRWNRQGVPKRRHITFRSWGITQKTIEYNTLFYGWFLS